MLALVVHIHDLHIRIVHYINVGPEGLHNFNFLLNYIIKDVNLASVEELNIAYVLLLHKGHLKSRTSDSDHFYLSISI